MAGVSEAPRPSAAVDKRRVILGAAVRVFARQGFHACRVSDIAREAGVAYGLVYHYFDSKDAILDTLFAERWNVLLRVIAEAREGDGPVRDRLRTIAGFIIDSYRHDPDLMKVVIVEVTRAANSFGRTHLAKITAAHEGVAGIVADAQARGAFPAGTDARSVSLAFFGIIEQFLTGWIFGLLPADEPEFERATEFVVRTVCGAPATGIECTSVPASSSRRLTPS